MKKITISLAFIAASNFAIAQSSVTLFGTVDATLQIGKGSVLNQTGIGSGGLTSSRFGFRGVEDLGGGMSAGFWLEGAFSSDTGVSGTTNTNNQTTGAATGLFGRRSTVSLSGNFGEVRLGRDFSVQYYNRNDFDPFALNGVGASQVNVGSAGGVVNARVSNALMYFLPPNLGGIYGEAQVYFGENTAVGATEDDGTGGGARIGYKNGPVNVQFAHARTRYARTATAGDIKATNFGGSYEFGDFTLSGGLYRDKVERLTDLTGRGFQVGGRYRVGSGEFKANYSAYKTTAAGNPETKKISLGYVHNLSKRTALYGTYARVNNSGGATTALNSAITGPNQSSSGVDFGLRHSF